MFLELVFLFYSGCFKDFLFVFSSFLWCTCIYFVYISFYFIWFILYLSCLEFTKLCEYLVHFLKSTLENFKWLSVRLLRNNRICPILSLFSPVTQITYMLDHLSMFWTSLTFSPYFPLVFLASVWILSSFLSADC